MMGNEDYREEFENPSDIRDFEKWMRNNLDAFIQNMYRDPRGVLLFKPLSDWIGMFLSWSEYNDYINSNKNG